MSSNISPQKDFYQHVNHKWLEENPLPQGYSRYTTFSKLAKETSKILNDMTQNLPNENRIKILYDQLFNDSDKNIKEQLKPFLDQIENIKTEYDISNYFQLCFKNHIGTPFSIGSDTDLKNSSKNTLYISEGGLSLPDRDYYLEDDKKQIREKYVKLIEDASKLTGIEINAKDIMYLETKMAKYSMKREEKRDPFKIYNKCSLDDVNIMCPSLHWSLMLKYINDEDGYFNNKKIVVTNCMYFRNMSNKFLDLDKWKEYFKWKIVLKCSSYMGLTMEKLFFDFYDGVISGVKEMKPKEERVMDIVDNKLGELLGMEYIKKYFTPSAKQSLIEMTNDIKEILRERLQINKWMTEETKIKALEKLGTFKQKIGYPDKWDTDKEKRIAEMNFNVSQTNTLFENILNIDTWSVSDDLRDVYNDVDKEKWYMNPQDINAYYSPTENEIVFPAGILQFPFFDLSEPMEYNYGGIGTVIGHEIIHGFDDKGSLYDKDGNLNKWWSDEDRNHFEGLVSKFGSYIESQRVNDKTINPKLTMGEAIADLGGLTLTTEAVKRKYGKDKLKGAFEGFARVWACHITDEEQDRLLTIDPHPPAIYRVNGTVKQVPSFFETFDIKENDGMFNENVIEIY